MAEAQTKFMPGTENDANGFPENFVNKIFIDTKPTVNSNGDVDLTDVTNGNWAWLAGGINNVTPSTNETSSNDAYYDGGGFTETDVTGKQAQLAIQGNRKLGDPAQDYVGGKYWKFGNAVKTRVIWICNGIPVIAKCTLTNVVPTGGAANAKQNFSFTIAFNGRPMIFNGQLTMTLTSKAAIYSASVDTSKKSDDDSELKAIVIETVTDQTPAGQTQAGSQGTTPSTTGAGDDHKDDASAQGNK